MTLEEAIKLLTELRPMLSEVGFDKYKASVNLGNEALKRLQEHRSSHIDITYRALPGETKL